MNNICKFFSVVILLLTSMLSLSAQASDAVLVFGGSSGCGLETVKLLRSEGRDVTVFVRPTSNRSGLDPLDVNYVVGDVLNEEDVKAAFESGSFGTVISSLGGRRGEPRPDYIGNKHITDYAVDNGVTRIVQVSAIGVDTAPTEKPEPTNFMGVVMYEKKRAETYLAKSGLDYTIIRPGGLIDGPATGKGEMYNGDDDVSGSIMRSDVAALILGVLDDDDTYAKVYNVMDPTINQMPPGAAEINRLLQQETQE